MKISKIPDRRPVVAHSLLRWLPITATWIYNQIYNMSEFSSIVLAYTTLNTERFPWNPVYSLSNGYNRFLFNFLKRLHLRTYPFIYDTAIKKHQPLILHSHFGDRGWHNLKIADKYNLKHVVTFYGYDVNMLPNSYPVWKERYKLLFDKADLFLCEGPHMAQCIVELGCPKEKIKVQRLGVEIDKIPYVQRNFEDGGLLKILIASTFREKKGISYALEAIGILKENYPNIKVTLIGDSTGIRREEEEKKKIINMIKRYDLGSITKMLGFQPYHVLLEEAYKHHIFLSPSVTASDGDTEGGAPVTFIEMLASGMPVISTWHCDIPEIVQHEKSGLLYPERDSESLVKGLMKIVEGEVNLSEMGYNGRKYVEENFNILKLSESLAGHYRAIISRR